MQMLGGISCSFLCLRGVADQDFLLGLNGDTDFSSTVLQRAFAILLTSPAPCVPPFFDESPLRFYPVLELPAYPTLEIEISQPHFDVFMFTIWDLSCMSVQRLGSFTLVLLLFARRVRHSQNGDIDIIYLYKHSAIPQRHGSCSLKKMCM